MRRLLMVLLMLCMAGTVMASVTGNVSDTIKEDPGVIYINPPTRITGDTIGDPFFITVLPSTVTGTTVGFAHDYDEACPYSGSLAPDVVYSFTPTADIAINVDLCYSSYDTKVYVYMDAATPGAPLACNDDFYFGAPCYTYSSKLEFVPCPTGHTYYIVIDGYGSQSGSYNMVVTDAGTPPPIGACCAVSGDCTITTQTDCPGNWQGENTVCVPNPCPPPPPVECPEGAVLENEAPCPVSGVDTVNGGCNSTPNVWSYLNPQEGNCGVMCGTSCASTSYRDTDWIVSIGMGATVTGTCVGAFPLQYILIYGSDCGALAYIIATADPSVPVTLSYFIEDGAEVWNWVGLSTFVTWPTSDWVLDVCGIQNPPPPPGACCRNGLCLVMEEEMCIFFGGVFQGYGTLCEPNPCEPVATESTTWGTLKNLYR